MSTSGASLTRRKVGADWGWMKTIAGWLVERLAPLTRPSGTLSPLGRGRKKTPPTVTIGRYWSLVALALFGERVGVRGCGV